MFIISAVSRYGNILLRTVRYIELPECFLRPPFCIPARTICYGVSSASFTGIPASSVIRARCAAILARERSSAAVLRTEIRFGIVCATALTCAYVILARLVISPADVLEKSSADIPCAACAYKSAYGLARRKCSRNAIPFKACALVYVKPLSSDSRRLFLIDSVSVRVRFARWDIEYLSLALLTGLFRYIFGKTGNFIDRINWLALRLCPVVHIGGQTGSKI